MDCHAPIVFYGYELHLPPEMNARSSISLLYDLNGMIEKPFEIRSILPYFPPFVDDTVITDGMICIVIGFTPTTARETYHHSKELAAYIRDNHVLDGFHVADRAMFHCGIEWQPEVDSGAMEAAIVAMEVKQVMNQAKPQAKQPNPVKNTVITMRKMLWKNRMWILVRT